MTTRKYAVRDGDRGLAWDGQYAFVLVVRRGGAWFYRWLGSDGPLIVDKGTVYRLTGWGADGPTEQWVEPMEPVVVRVGLEVIEWFTREKDRDVPIPYEPDASDLVSCMHRTFAQKNIDAANRPGYAELIFCYRCAATGAPLRLPTADDAAAKEPGDD